MIFPMIEVRSVLWIFLGDYQGYVHADAYSGYDELFRRKGVIEVGCWVHTRRHFDEAVSSQKSRPPRSWPASVSFIK